MQNFTDECFSCEISLYESVDGLKPIRFVHMIECGERVFVVAYFLTESGLSCRMIHPRCRMTIVPTTGTNRTNDW